VPQRGQVRVVRRAGRFVMAWILVDEYLWHKLIGQARSISITYQRKVRIRGEREGGVWWYRAYLPNGRPCSAKYRLHSGQVFGKRVAR
jgi:hypothetical protein